MPDLFDVFFRWWKQIFSLVVISMVAAFIVLFFIPQKYMSMATALPAAPYATDKTGVFSQDLQNLYSALGTPDDLDRIVGTALLDTVYVTVATQLNLVEHYQITKTPEMLHKAASWLKNNTRVIKNDYGELQIKVWDGDRNVAANAANAIFEKLQEINRDVQSVNNEMMLSKIKEEYLKSKNQYQELSDSASHSNNSSFSDIVNVQKASLLEQIKEYEKLMNQYQLMTDAHPQALIIVERAHPSLKPDQPKKLQIIIIAGVLSLLFGFLMALVLEKRRSMTK